jgi:gas vesicle protein
VQEESAKTVAKAKSDANQAIRGVSEQVGRDIEALNDLRKSLTEESAQALPKLQEELGRVMGEVTDQVQQQANMLCSLLNLIEKESAQILSKVKNDVAEALAENSRLVEQQMKSAQASLSDWETRMGSRVELQLQQLEGKARTSLETLQEQTAELLKCALEKLHSESRALPEQLEASLKKAAENIERDWIERIQGKQQQMADEIIEASAAQLGKQLGANLDLFTEQLKLKQEHAANGIAESFRSKMVEMLSVFQSAAGISAPPPQPPSPDKRSL